MFFRYASTVALAAFCLVFVGNLIVDNPLTHKFLRKAIRERLAATPYHLSFEALDASIFPGGVDLYGVKAGLKPTDSQPAIDLFESSIVKARISWWGLFIGEQKLSVLEFNELRTKYVVEPSPDTTPEQAVKELLWPPPFKLPIDSIRLRGSTVHLVVKGKQPIDIALEAKLMGLDFEFDISNYEDMSAEIDVSHLDFSAFDKTFVSGGKLGASLKVRDRKLSSERFFIASTGLTTKGSISGSLEGDEVEEKRMGFVRSKRLKLTRFKINPSFAVERMDFGLVGKLLEVPESSGDFAGKVDLFLTAHLDSHSSPDWHLEIDGQLKDSYLAGFGFMDSRAVVRIDENQLDVKSLALIHDGKALGDAKGTLSFVDAMAFDFNLQPKALPLSRLLSSVKVKEFDAVDLHFDDGALAITGDGHPFKLDVKGTAHAKQVVFPTLNVPNTLAQQEDCAVSIGLKATSTRLVIFERQTAVTCNHRGKSIRIPVGGFADFEQERLRFEVVSRQMDLSLLANAVGQPIAGTGAFSLVATGDAKGTSTTILPEIVDFRLGQGLAFDHVDARIETNSGDKRILIPYALGGFREQGGYFEVENAWLEPSANDRFAADVEIVNLPAEFIERIATYHKLDFPYTCVVKKANGHLKGHLFTPMSMVGDIEVDAQQCRTGEAFLTDRIQGTLSMTSKQIAVDNAKITNGTLTSHLALTFNKSAKAKPRLKMQMKSAPRRSSPHKKTKAAEKLAFLPIIGPYLQNAGFDGEVSYDFELEDNGKDSIGLVTAHFAKIDFKGRKVPDVELRSTIKNGEVNTIISRDDKSILGRLFVNLSGKGMPYNLYLRHKMFDYRFLVGENFSKDPRNYMYLDGALELQGTIDNFWQSRGSLSVDKLLFKYVTDFQNRVHRVDWRSERPFVLTMKNGAILAEKQAPLSFVGDDLKFTIEPKAMNLPDAMNFDLKGQVAGTILPKLFPKIEVAGGDMAFFGGWSGPITAPVLDINFDGNKDPSKKFQFTIAGFAPAVTDITGGLRIDQTGVTIKELAARKGKNSQITGSGRFIADEDTDEQTQVIVNVKDTEFRGMNLSVFKNVNVNLDGEIEISGKGKPYKVSGLVMIDRASSIGHFDIRQQLYDAILKRQFIAPVNLEPSILTFDIEVMAKKSIFIRNRNMKMVLTSDLRVLGSNENPLLLGVLRIDEGVFNYKRDFVVERGDIIFEGAASPPDPKLDIVGIAEIRPYRVQVLVNNHISDPKVDFLVEPHLRPDGSPLSKFDVLTLLTSGRVWDSNSSSTGTEFASAEALSLVVGRFEQPIEKLLELSGQTLIQNVFFDTYLAKNSERPIVRLNMPIHIHDDLNVVFRADEKRNLSLSSEYAINESISLFGSFEKGEEELNRTDNSGVVGDAGMDLKFHFSFP